MNKAVPIFLILFFSGFFLSAQIITLTGKVKDRKTREVLPGITLTSGNYGTSTNSKGEFILVIQKSIAEQHGITASSVGYQKSHMPYQAAAYTITLNPEQRQLSEVTVSARSESIVQRAFRKIPLNYPSNDFVMQGRLKMVHSAKDSTAYQYFYQNEAVVKLYYKSYLHKNTPQISLVSKKDSLISDPKSNFKINWVGGYTSVPSRDYVSIRALFLAGDTKKYDYYVNGKEWVNGHKVYVVNFSSKGKDENTGTLYIDTATYAYVRITHTTYHLKRVMFIDINKSTQVVDYRQYKGKWFLDAVKNNTITNYKGFDLDRITDYKSDAIDTIDIHPFDYPQVIAPMAQDINVNNETFPVADINSHLIPISSATDTILVKIPIPHIDTSGIPNTRVRIIKALKNYLTGDNIHYIIGIGTLPVRLQAKQPGLSNGINGITNYAIVSGTEFRLLKNKGLFLQWEDQDNFGIGGLKISESAYNLAYTFITHRGGHPISLQPHAGYSSLHLYQKEQEYYHQKSMLVGLNVTYEISRRLGVFINGRYYDPLKTSQESVVIKTQMLSAAMGIQYKMRF